MGDIIKKNTMTIGERIAEREQQTKEQETINENNVINSYLVSSNYAKKDKSICIRINSSLYKMFKEAAAKQGMSVNTCVTTLVLKFLKENN